MAISRALRARTFQNLRSSREPELAESFPIHVVTKWLGNSPKVAMKHYLQTTEEHFAKALKPVKTRGTITGTVSGKSDAKAARKAAPQASARRRRNPGK
jgi:hypothetical protein